MEQTMDRLAAILAADANLTNVTWILGDPLGGWAGELPLGFVVPYEDVPRSKTAGSAVGAQGLDHDDYLIEIVLVDDLRNYGGPQQVDGQDYYEQPGYRELIQMSQLVRATLRSNITLSGQVATSALRSIRFAPLLIDTTLYRACRIVLSATERRTRG